MKIDRFLQQHCICNGVNSTLINEIHRAESILGIGNLYFTVILFIALLSTHILQSPFFIDTRRAGTTQGLILDGLINLLPVIVQLVLAESLIPLN